MLNFKNKKTDLSLTVIIVIAILLLANYLSYQVFFRWDLTQNKDYSISVISKKAVAKLNDLVNIKVYFSKDLPTQYINLPQEVGDILNEYTQYANSNIKVSFINPAESTETEQEVRNLGIPELQFNVLEKDKYQIVKAYLGVVLEYGDKKEIIPVVDSTDNLEYKITLAIKKVTGQIKATIGILISNGTKNLSNEASIALQKLEELYTVQQVDLSKEKEIPADLNTLVILGPKDEFNDNQKKAIDKFFISGKSLLVALDGVQIKEGLLPVKNETGLEKLLENYGIKVNNDLVADVVNGMASFSQGFITFSTNYPFWPKITSERFDQKNIVVSKLESVVFPWASSLDVINEKIDKSNIISYLTKSTNKAKKQIDNYNINPQNISIDGKSGEFNIALSIKGKFLSAYKNGETANGRLVVIGDSDFVTDGFVRNTQDNLLFFQNLVDSISLDDDLINIRSKGVTERPLKETGDKTKATIKYANILGLTILVVLIGLSRYYFRRRTKFIDEI